MLFKDQMQCLTFLYICFNLQFEEENEEIGGGAEGGQGKRKRLFSKECK